MSVNAADFNDPINLQVMWNRLIFIADQADIVLGRTAFSPISARLCGDRAPESEHEDHHRGDRAAELRIGQPRQKRRRHERKPRRT